jgi:hypothetical protein
MHRLLPAKNHLKECSVSLNKFASDLRNRKGSLSIVMYVEDIGLFHVTSLKSVRSRCKFSICHNENGSSYDNGQIRFAKNKEEKLRKVRTILDVIQAPSSFIFLGASMFLTSILLFPFLPFSPNIYIVKRERQSSNNKICHEMPNVYKTLSN